MKDQRRRNLGLYTYGNLLQRSRELRLFGKIKTYCEAYFFLCIVTHATLESVVFE